MGLQSRPARSNSRKKKPDNINNQSSSRSIAITPVRRKNNECASHVELHPIWVNKRERNDSNEKKKEQIWPVG